MMARWFRMYAEALNDPKVQCLDGETFKSWINILCIASQNGGQLPDVSDVAFALRMDNNGAVTLLERLLNARLIDRVNGGKDGWHYAPHGWSKRQYKSDTSTDRVKRFRKRSETVSETPPDTETDTDNTLSKDSGEGSPSTGKLMWDEALEFYGSKRRALIAKWIKIYGAERFVDVMADCQRNDPMDRVAWTEAALKKRKGGEDDLSGFIC